MENFMTKKIKMWAALSFFFVFCFFAASANAASFKNYTVDGSSADWSSDELLGTGNYSGVTTSIYTTWSSTAIYFGLQDTPSCLHDYFIYISTSNSGGTNSSINWNLGGSSHTLPFNAHYAFVYDSDTLKGLYKYDAAVSSWVVVNGWSGSLISSSSTFGNIHELSIPMADLAITSATSIKVLVFTQDDVSNNVQHCFPEQNLSSRNPATFTKYFDFGTLSSGKIANTIPVNWRIYGLTADLNEGTYSGNLTAGFTPNNDNNQDNIYFDFLSAVDGSYVFTIDTNLDGVFDQNDYVVNSNIWADSYASPRVQWDGSKQNTGTPDPGQMMISKNIVDNNTTYYAQIKVTDSYGNTTTEQGSLGAWAVSGFATGKVIANGLPCAGAVVSVGKQQSESYYSGWDRYGVCDASGNFKVFGINADNSTYMLMAASSPYASTYSAPNQIGSVYGVDFGTITLTKGVKIYGTVTNFYTGAPISNAIITSYLETMSNSTTIWEQTNTDASGNYVDQVSSGNESITVSKDGFGNITADRTLLPGTTTQIDFVLAYGGSIYGQILSGTTPVANCSVSLYNSLNDLHDGSSSNSTQANSEGYYTFSNLAAGSYIVMADPSGIDSSLGFAYHTYIDVFENQTTNSSINPDVNINLPPAVAIEGIVSDAGGPLSNINVYLMWSDTQRKVWQYSVTTDTSGYYYIGGVSTGTGMDLHVSDKNGGHISQTSDLSFVTHPGTNTKDFLLTLPSGGISGNIINNTTHSGPFIIFALPAGSSAPKNNPDFVSMATSTGHYGINVATGLVYGVGIYNEAEQQVIARTIGVTEGTLNADIIISTGVSVSGDVKNAASSFTISDAAIEIISGAYLIGFSNSDSQGSFQVKYLPISSTFSARVNVTGFNTWTGILSTASLNHIYLTPDPALDTQKPVISFISPAINGLIGYINPTILATLSDGDGTGINVASTTMSLDASPVTPSFNPSNGELSYDCSGLSEGSHTVYLSVRDNATIPNISNINWTFMVDTSTPIISFNCYDLDGNHDKHLNANSGSLEPSLQSDFSANENGNYSLYFDMNDNGVFDDGVDYFPASASSSVPYNLAYTTGTLGSSQWMNGSLYDKNGSWYGQISEGVYTLVFEFTDGLHIVKSTVAITVDRTNPTLQITHPAGSEQIIVRNNFFDVDYSLSEDCYTIDKATTMISAMTMSTTNYPLLGDQLKAGGNKVLLDGSPLNILTDNASLHLTLSGYDLAGNYNSTEINTNCLVAPSTPTYFVAVASSTPRTAVVSWGAPGDDGMLNQLQAGSVFALQYSQNPDVVWSSASVQIVIVTTSSINPGDSQSVTLSSNALNGNTTYYFKLWTRDENVDCWSNTSTISSAYILLGDTIAPAAVTTLVARTADTLGGNVKLSWGVPGDDGMFGSLPVGSQYKVQYATVASGDSLSGWDYPLAQITVSTSNVTPGDVVSQIVGSLTSGVTYYFAIWHADEVSNWSAVSNISSACASEALPITSGTISGVMSYNGSFVGVYKVAIASAIGDNGVMSFVTPVTSFTGAGYYSFSSLPLPNTFYVMALIDENDNDMPDGYEPTGYFRQESNWWNATPIYLSASSHTASNVNFSLFDFGAISGHITNNSEQIGNIVVIASPSFGGASPYNVTESTPNTPAWDYSLRVSTPYGFYKVIAFVDVNGNGWLDSNEYYSIYADSVPVASQFNSLGIDIAINTVPPAAPSSFNGTVQSTGSIQWSWTLSANATYYVVYTTSGDVIAEVSEGISEYTQESLGANSLNSAYVKAGNISGISGASNSDAKYTYAIIPSSVSVNAVNVSSITLSWADTGAIAYRLERDSVFVATVPATSYSDTGLSADTYYAYRVGAINNELIVSPGYSSVANALTLPASPSGFIGIAIGTDTIKWQWNHGTTYVSGYNIYTSTGFELAIGLVSNVTAYIETGLNANTQYTRMLKQYNGAGLSSATTTQKYTYAIIPSSVSVNAVNVSSITLSWADTGAIAYRLERDSVFVATVPATSYSDTGLSADTYYAYRVGAINNELIVSPGYSSVANALTLPASPSGFIGIAIGTDTIKWQWSHGTTYVSGYNLYDSLGNDIALGLTSDVTAYIESGLALNTTHYRYLTQYNSSGESGATNLVGRFTLPRTPQSASFSEVYYTSATLNWDANGNASTTTIYEVIQSTDTNFGLYTTPVPFASHISTNSVLINTLIPGATSYFKVRAQNPDGIAGDYSNVASAFVVVKTRKWVSTSLSNSLNSEAWEPAGVPQNGETIIFDGTGNGDCHWVSDISIASMTILSPSTSTIMLISDLNIDGDLDMQSGYMSTEGGSTVTIKGDWKQTGGIVTLNTGGVSFAGTLAQKVIQTQNSYFNNFSVITSSYVQANSNLNIKGDLYFPSGAGSFNANNNAVQMGSLSMYAGSLTAGSATHTITGNFLVSGGAEFDAGTGALSFAGTTDQTIYPGSAGFNNVLIESTGTVSITMGTMNVFGNFDINHGGFDTNNAMVSLRGSGNMTQKSGTTFNPRGTWQTHGIQTQTLSPLAGTFDVFEVYGTSLTQIITPAASVQISSMLVSGNSQFDCYDAKPMTVINTLYIDGKFNLNGSTLTAIGGIGAYNSSTFDMGNGSIYLAGGSTISVSGILNTYGTYNTITSSAGYFGFIISGATLNVNGLTLSGSNGVSIDTFTIVNGMFGFRKINFLNTKPGATAITFMPATGVYIMQNCSFDANVGVNVSAINMSSPSVNDIRMDNATGAKAGHAYENDPNNVVFWGTPSAFTFFTGSALSDSSIEVSWSDVNEETSYTIYSGTTDVSGELPAGTTSFMGTGLLPNKAYTAFVRAHNPVGYTDSTSSNIYTLSKSPSSLTTLGVTSDTIRVSWYENTNPEGTQYKLYYSTDQADFAQSLDITTLTTATITGLVPYTTYYMQVTAFNVPGVESSPSNQISARTNRAAPSVPGSFTGVVLSSTTIEWSWSLANSATYYVVLNATGGVLTQIDDEFATTWLEQNLTPNTQYTRSVKAGNISGQSAASTAAIVCTYAVVPSSVSVNAVNVSSITLSWVNTGANSYRLERDSVFVASVTGTSYSDTSLSADTYYAYRVGAINNELVVSPGYSDVSNVLTLPLAPSGVIGSAISTDTIRWQWNRGSANIGGYNVYTSTGFELVSGLTPATTAGIETGLLPNTLYTRVIKQYNITGESDGTTMQKYTYANTPATINITTGSVTSTSIALNWTDSGATAYRIERDNVFVASVTGTSYNDAGLSGDTTYYYKVAALNGDSVFESGVYSASASTQTKPGALSGANGIANSTTSITWKWDTGSTYASGYNVYTSTGGALITGLSYTTTGWVETGLSINTQYTRIVKQYNATGESAGATMSRYTLANAPAGLSISSATEHSLTLSWNANNGSTSPTFRIDRSQDNTNWTTIINISAGHTGTNYVDSGLALATTYYYAVFAANGESILSTGSTTAAGFTGQLQNGINIIITTATYEQQQSSGDVTVIIPPGAMSTTGYILINGDAGTNPIEVTLSELLSANDALSGGARIVPGATVELHYYDLNGTTVTGNFAQKIQLVLTYPDANNDDLVDGVTPPMRAEDLRIYRLNTITLLWEVVPGAQVLDKTAKTISVFIEHFSIYTIVSINSAQSTLGGVKVYPNPYKPGSASAFNDTTLGSGVVFDNLTAKAKIRIYNIAGELVAELYEDNGDGRYIWPATNNNGNAVASGVYIYIITNPDDSSQKVKGKVVVIK